MSRDLIRALPIVCVLALGAAWGLTRRAPPPPDNILVIVLDTTRQDRLLPYGYDRETTPNIQALADRGAVFDAAYSHANWTAPSVASLMTSRTPRDHGVTAWFMPLHPDRTTLSEVLETQGYHTMAVVSHVLFKPELGFAQGFVEYDLSALEDGRNPHTSSSSGRVTDSAIALLDDWDRQQPFLLWAHYFDPHNEYRVHPEHTSFGDTPSDRYDGELVYTDFHVGRLLDELDDQGLTEHTWVVLLADHGEEFGDHGGRFHRAKLYDELVRIPLIIAGPGITPHRVSEVVRNIDIAPTLMTLTDQELPDAFNGEPIPLSAGTFQPGEGRPALIETRLHADKRALVQWPHKVIRDLEHGHVQLFDLEADPQEYTNLARRYPELREDLLASLDAYFATPTIDTPSAELTPEQTTQLGLLGYLEEEP